MSKGLFVQSFFQAAFMMVLVLSLLDVTTAQVRSSNNYQLQSDSVNVGGGFSSSTSYWQESTVGEVATGLATSSNYELRAGYQQMQEVYLSLSTTGNVTLSPDLPGITGGTANGSSTFTVLTDSPSGYQLTIAAEGSPAMQSGVGTIADYTPVAETDFSFNVSAGEAFFGYTPEGVDIPQRFLDDGGTCNTGGTDTSLSCWDGLSTTAAVIASGSGSNHPSGATTTVTFRLGIGNGAGVTAGVYTATTTVTALPL